MMEHIKAGRIDIKQSELVKLLGYEGGKINYIGTMPDTGLLGIIIEHPDMPDVAEAEVIPIVDRREI